MDVLDYIFIILYTITGFVIISFSNKGFNIKDRNNLKKLLFYHLFFGLLFYFFTVGNKVDSYTYWITAKKIKLNTFNDLFNYSIGTNIVYLLNYIPANILSMSYFQGTMLYSFLGFLGILYLYSSIKTIFNRINIVIEKNKLFPLILFLPNFHFWSSGIGKDSIAFFCICYIIYGLVQKKYFKIIIPAILIYVTRPHIIFLFLTSFVIAFLLDSKIKGYKKIMILIISSILIAIVLPKIISFVNIESLNLQSIENYTKNKAEALSRDNTGSRVDTSSYSIYYKVFTFLFRPLFFDVTNLMSLIVSIENFMLLILVFKMSRKRVVSLIKKAPYIIKGLLIFYIISALAFSLILGNLGIMIRMKNMLMPGFIIVVLWVLSVKKNNKTLFRNE